MARIRTIKPEFPQSESMGKVSRDARLLFIMLWTLCDDTGRARASSRLLASLLYPYDDDAVGLMDGWMRELECAGVIDRYQVDGACYLQVRNWLKHQKIDHASPSKHPPKPEILANTSEDSSGPRERSCEDQGSRIKDQGRDQGGVAQASAGFENRGTSLPDVRGTARPIQGQGAHEAGELLPGVPRGAHAPDPPEAQRAGPGGAEEGGGAGVQPNPPAAREAGADGVPGVRGADGGEAPPGPIEPTAGRVHVQAVPPEGARETAARAAFLRFMAAYPKGLYRGPARLRAERVFYRLLDDEEDPEEMIEGAERYQAQQRALNKIGSQFIMNPDKFLLERDWDDEFALPPDPAQQAAEERDAKQQADMDRVRAWAVGRGCPYRPHEHETAALFETRVRSWLNHEGRPETGTGPARAIIQPPAAPARKGAP